MVLPSIAIWALRSAPPWVAKRLGSSPQRRLVSARVRRGSHHSCHFSLIQALQHIGISRGGWPRRSLHVQHLIQPRSSQWCPLRHPAQFRFSRQFCQHNQAQNQGHGVANPALTAPIRDLLKSSIHGMGIDLFQTGWQFTLHGKCVIVHTGSLAFWLPLNEVFAIIARLPFLFFLPGLSKSPGVATQKLDAWLMGMLPLNYE